MSVPELPSDLDNSVDVGRLLMGDDRGNAVLPLFADRAMMFNAQPLRLDSGVFRGLFYERLRNTFEVLSTLVVSLGQRQRGIAFPLAVQPVLAITMFPSFFDATDGNVPMPAAGERPVGEHSVTLSGFASAEELEDWRLGFWHFFSQEWGKDMSGSIPMPYFTEYAQEAQAIRVSGGPQPDLVARGQSHMDRELGLRRLIEGHQGSESTWIIGHRDDEVVWAGRWLIGAGTGDMWLQAALLVRGITNEPLLAGWMFCRAGGAELFDVEEFFIWPRYRCKGYGTALAGRTLLFARVENFNHVRWIEQEADALVNVRVPIRVPSWLGELNWRPPTEEQELGWRVSRVTEPVDSAPLLRQLGQLHALGGVHLAWRDGTVTVADHHFTPMYGIVVEQEVWPAGHEKATKSLYELDEESRRARRSQQS